MWTEFYKLPLNYKIEHKPLNTASVAFTINKADYALLSLNKEEVFKFRGQRDQLNLSKLIASSEINQKDVFVDLPTFEKLYFYEEKVLQSINDYLVESKNNPDAISPGREKMKSKKFSYKCIDINFSNMQTWEKVKKAEVDFALPVLEKLRVENPEKISIRDFFEEINREKENYLKALIS